MQNLFLRIRCLAVVILFAIPGTVYSQQAPGIQWQKCLGGTGDDGAKCIIQTSDSGYVMAGSTISSDGDVSGDHINGPYNRDAWIVKLSPSGALQWQKCLGGTGDDAANCIIQTKDGGYAIAGLTTSNDGDVSGIHGSNPDAWIIKLSSSGAIEWQKCFGGSFLDQANSIIQTSDGGYTVAGFTSSIDGDVSGNHGGSDAWVIHIDSLGNLKWQQCYGGSGEENANSIARTVDGGYIIGGSATSADGEVTRHHIGGVYQLDAWIIKIDSIGKLQWQKCLGGEQDDAANSIIETPGHEFIFAGFTSSSTGDVIGYHINADSGNSDFWVVKLDLNGNIVWQKCLGGSDDDRAFSIANTSDQGVVATGYTRSSDGDVSGNHQNTGYDAWLVKLDFSGDLEWQKCLGGTDGDEAYSVIQDIGDGYTIAGTTKSNNDGDVSGFHGGEGYDAWVVNLNAVLGAPSSSSSNSYHLSLSVYPNPAYNTATISFDVPQTSLSSRIVVRNVLGELIQQVQLQSIVAGYTEMPLDLRGFSDGTYFITVTTCGLSETTAVTLIK